MLQNNHLITSTDPLQLIDYCLADLAEVVQSKSSLLNERAFLLVPEALKADLERRYVTKYAMDGLMLAEVVSFNRLAHRIFSIAGGLASNTISKLGKTLLIQRLIYDNSSKFKRFQRFAGIPGYTAELEKVLSDFKRFDLNNQTLNNLADLAPPSLTKDKLFDFSTLQNLYEQEMKDLDLLDQDDNLDRLAKLLENYAELPELNFLKNTRIWITGFADIRSFNQQELKIINLLSQYVKQLSITVLKSEDIILEELFEPGNKAYFQLRQLLPQAKLIVLENQLSEISQTIQKSFLTGTLTSEQVELQQNTDQNYDQFTLVAAEDQRQEWSFVAGEIKRLLKENKYGKKDIGIAVCGNFYDLSLEKSILREFNLDTFLSERLPVRQTPLYRYLEGLFNISTNDFKLNDLLAFLRSGLVPAADQEIDTFENICLEFGLQYASQIQADRAYERIKDEERKAVALEFKRIYLDPVFVFVKHMRGIRQGKEKSKALLRWLGQDSFRNRLQTTIDHLRKIGEEDISLSLARSWELVLQLLEESIELLGTSRISQKGFGEIILGTLAGQIPSSIPVGLDRIRVGTPLEMIYYDCKVIFIVGADQSTFPPSNANEGFLHNMEVDWIEEISGKSLPNYKRNQLIAGQLTTMLTLTTPQDRVYLSTPHLDKTEWPSIFELLHNELDSDTELASEIGLNLIVLGDQSIPDQRWLTESRTKRFLKIDKNSNDFEQQEKVDFGKSKFAVNSDLLLPRAKTYWRKSLDILMGQAEEQSLLKEIIVDPLDEIKPYIYLDSKLSEKTMARQSYFSASSLESFQACPYKYFADYSLRLRERPIWEANPRDRGTLIHSMMELALSDLHTELHLIPDSQERSLVFSNWLNLIEQAKYYDDLYDKSIASAGVLTYADKAIAAGQGRRIKRHVRNTLWFNSKLISPDGFWPLTFEWKFPPPQSDASSFDYEMLDLSPTNKKISLRGIIDRIDLNQDFTYRLYDYKTGNKKIDLEKIYLGLDLQLGLYQKIWQINHPQHKVDSIGYMLFKNNSKKERTSFLPTRTDLKSRLLSQPLVQEIKADSNSINAIGDHAVHQSKQAIIRIQKGFVAPIPQATKLDNLPCTYCPHSEMCRYDQRLIAKRAEILSVPPVETQEINKETNEKEIITRDAKDQDIIEELTEIYGEEHEVD